MAVATLVGGIPRVGQSSEGPPVRGLDHVSIAVRDLDSAAAHYRDLGFVLKPGRHHSNGIRNQHVKFQDGTELELITASEARDKTSSEYVHHLESGDGPKFAVLYAPSLEQVEQTLQSAGMLVVSSGQGIVSYYDDGVLQTILFGGRNASPTDLREHFHHPNGAEALIRVWGAGTDLSLERDLLALMGAEFQSREVHVPGPLMAEVASFPEGEVVLLPASRELIPDRRIVGVTLRTRDIDLIANTLASRHWKVPGVIQTSEGRSLTLPPYMTHGLWIEFLEQE